MWQITTFMSRMTVLLTYEKMVLSAISLMAMENRILILRPKHLLITLVAEQQHNMIRTATLSDRKK